ncbi:hypothetical protein [Butyrivibrio sp. XPD2002]|uniref:hypothetical protein n=1 Tax=Butyrivibrio sp. XPD2002 TaxID=1280665 RepID=UPI00041D4CA2|nr:hypothetical protein [Butyrivibrio sp. XPD2002]
MAKEVESEFRLLPEEAVILRNDKVGTGSSILPVRSDELVLTNQALIHIKKELFGKVKEDEVVVCPFCGTSNKMRAC